MKPNRKSSFFCILLIISTSVFYTCTNPADISGTGSETGNAAVVGILYSPDGVTPAKNAKVLFVTYKHQPSLAKRLASTAVGDSTTTDSTGQFSFDSMPADTYNIYGEDSLGNLSYQDSVVIVGDTANPDTIPPDTLRSPGSISGFIKMEPADDPRTVTMYVIGAIKYALPEADGSFMLEEMAEGEYRIRIRSTDDKYAVLDTIFAVEVGVDLILPDSIELPLKIPKVAGFSIDYDTLKQIVSLYWNLADTAKISGYNIYRQHVDSLAVKLNVQPITDTFYVDSTALQDNSYTYQVSSVDKNGNEGLLSAGVGVEVVSAFEITDTLFTAGGNIKGITIDSKGNIVIVRYITPYSPPAKVERYNITEQLLNSWDIFDGVDDGSPANNVVVDDSGLIYVVNNSDIVLKFDSAGSLVNSFQIQGRLGGFGIYKDTLYVGSRTQHTITAYRINGDSLFAWGGNGFTDGQFFNMVSLDCDNQGNVYVEDAGPTFGRIQIFGKDGSFIKSISLEKYSLAGAQLDVRDSTILVPGHQTVYCFNTDGIFQWRVSLISYVPISAFYDLSGNIKIALFTGEIISLGR